MSRFRFNISSPDPGDDDRYVRGIGLRFNVETLTNLNREGTRLAWVTFVRGSLDAFLSQLRNASEIPVDVDHEVDGLVHLTDLHITTENPDVLRIGIEVKDSPAGDKLLLGVLSGELRGFSGHYGVNRSRVVGERDGHPVVTVLEATLEGMALCPEPGDPGCVFTWACDQPIEWQVREQQLREAEEREEVLRNLRPVPRLARDDDNAPRVRWGAAQAFGW